MSTPHAVGIPPSPYALGADGKWWGFPMTVGTLGTTYYVLPNTALSIQYLILQEGCALQGANCPQDRGGIWSPLNSDTSEPVGTYALSAGGNATANSPNNVGNYYLDDITVGYSTLGGNPAGVHLIAGISSTAFYVGYIGLMAAPLAIGNYTNSHESLLQSLFSNNQLPSTSWGYTAGASYELNGNGPRGSLTYGGFDASRFIASEQVVFPMNTDVTKTFSVDVSSVMVGLQNAQSDTITMVIDTTFPYIALPAEACQVFADVFNLAYNEELNIYGWTNETHDALDTSSLPNVTFTLSGNDGATTMINLPFGAFDLLGVPPFLNYSFYFPLQNASSSDEFVLGRSFMQEAYLIANFDSNNFTVAPALFEANNSPNLVDIVTPRNGSTSNSGSGSNGGGGSSNAGAIAGGVVGGVVAILAILFGIWFYRRRQRRNREAASAGKRQSAGYPTEMAELGDKRQSQFNPDDHEGTAFVGSHEQAEEHDAGHLEGPQGGFYGPGAEKAAQQEGHTTDGIHELETHAVEMDATEYHEAGPGLRDSTKLDDDHDATTATGTGTATAEASSSSNRGSSEHEKL